jgi:glutamate synthase domain-containing protein 3
MGGLKELTAEQIGYIQNHKERFSINYSDDMSGTFLYCYDPDMTLKSFLDLAACSSFRTAFNYKKHKFPGNEPQDPEQNEQNPEKPTAEEAKTIANHFKRLKSKDCAENWDTLSEEETTYLWKYHCVKFFVGYD